MPAVQFETIRRVLDQVRSQVAPESSDGELLRRWHRERDEAAFAGLVKRHGGLVLGVCRRVIRDAHAAEDAFQATFLVLAKKAGSVRPPEVVGPWLYGVAYRTALKARGRAVRRQQVEHAYAATLPPPNAQGIVDTSDLGPLIDDQVSALPEKYRQALVLCGVQGLAKAEAADRLGLPEGTISSRLARAREMLRERLARRGVIVPAAAIASLLTPATLQASTRGTLITATTESCLGLNPVTPTVLTLTHEVLRSMTLAKFKWLAAVAVAFAVSGGGFGLYSATADDKKPQPAPESVKRPDKPQPESVQKPDQPKPEKPKGEGPRLSKGVGKITNVIPTDRTIAVIRKTDSGQLEQYIAVAEDAKITVDGKAAELKDVPKEAMGAYLLKPGAKDGELSKIVELHVTGGNVAGVVVKLEAETLTLDVSGKEGKIAQQVVVRVGPDVKVIGIKDGGAKLSDLKAGDRVMVTLTADGKGAIQINSTVGRPEGEKPGIKPEKPGDRKPESDKPGVKKPDAEKPANVKPKPEKPTNDK